MSTLLNHSVCHKRFPLSPTKLCLLWEEILLKRKDDMEFKNVNDVVTKRTPSCLVHLDISKSSDCIPSHGCSSRKWIMLRNGQRWACKHCPISFPPVLLPFHLPFIILKCVFLWERGVWSLGSGVVSEELWAFPLLLLSLFLIWGGGCTVDALLVQRRVNCCTTFP